MKNERKEFVSKYKYYHTIILGLILSSFLILNSNYVNNQRAQNKLNIEKSRLFDKIISGRNLEGEEDKKSGTDQVCEKGSEELRSYYKSGNLGDIKLEDGSIKCEDKDKDYMKAIINIIKSQLGGGKNEDGEENENQGSVKEPETPDAPALGDRRNLQNEEGENKGGDEDLTQNVMTYGKHLLPVLIFLVIGILCIPGWLMCCFCCCCNCCCCCCCKKPCCKIPCFVITFALYALVVGVCFYGLTQSNKIFVGIADTECSILKFFDEILDGESKETLPKWAGIDGIQTMLDNIKGSLTEIKTNSLSELNSKIDGMDAELSPKKIFLNKIENAHKTLFENNEGNPPYKEIYSKYYKFIEGTTEGSYVLDIIKNFGKYDTDHKVGTPNGTLIWWWVEEFKLVSENADKELTKSKGDFNKVLNENFGEFTKTLDEGKGTIGDLRSTFNDFKTEISGMIADSSGTIDNYGKLGVKVVFGVLALLNIAIAVFMLLLCFCSGKCCTKCCCCRCICKLFTHLLWNILALLMIIVFLIGSLFAIIGKIGSDGMNVISYIVSEDNIGKGGDNILVDQLGDNVKFLRTCLVGNGSLEHDLDLDLDKLNSLDEIKDAEKKIEDAKKKFEENKQMKTYNEFIGHLKDIYEDLKSENHFGFMLNEKKAGEPIEYLDYKIILDNINFEASKNHQNDKWEGGCSTEFECNHEGATYSTTVGIDSAECLYPYKCLPSNRQWIIDSNNNTLKLYANIITDATEAIKYAYEESSSNGGYKKKLEELSGAYENFLNEYISTLNFTNEIIKRFTDQIKEYTGEDGGIFSFVNCAFIKTNLKIILKYLKEALGGNLYTVGICLILVGCSLILSISFTILLIIVINADIDNKKKTT